MTGPRAEEVGAKVLSDHPCQLGEGPTYDPGSNTAWWFDIVERKLFEHRFGTGTEIVHELPFMASALAFIDDERQLVAGEAGLYIRDIRTGSLSLHTPLEADDPTTRSNDGRVHPSGALWIGTMGRREEKRAGAIYWFFRGELRRLYAGITIPNAISFSPDAATAYFTDTAGGILSRVAVDPASGLPAGEPAVFFDHRHQEGGLDGAVVDAEGVLWNARWGAGCIDAYSPEGRRIRSLSVPARQPSCPAFVGRDLGRLLVTSAWQGLSEADRAGDPQAGNTFVLGLPTRGRPEPRAVIA